jgi:hypothetical protein
MKLDGTKIKSGERKFLIHRRSGAGTVVLTGLETIGSDHEYGTPSCFIVVTADTTNGSLKIQTTNGESATYDWVATLYYTQISTQ